MIEKIVCVKDIKISSNRKFFCDKIEYFSYYGAKLTSRLAKEIKYLRL